MSRESEDDLSYYLAQARGEETTKPKSLTFPEYQDKVELKVSEKKDALMQIKGELPESKKDLPFRELIHEEDARKALDRINAYFKENELSSTQCDNLLFTRKLVMAYLDGETVRVGDTIAEEEDIAYIIFCWLFDNEPFLLDVYLGWSPYRQLEFTRELRWKWYG